MTDDYYGNDENYWNDECDFFNEEMILKKRSEEEKGKVIDLDQYLESSKPIYDDDEDIDWLLSQEEEILISSPTRFVSNDRVPESTTQQEAQLGCQGSADWESQANFTMQYLDGNSYSGNCYSAPSRDVYDVSLWEKEEVLISSPTRFVSNDRVSEPIAQQKEFEHYEESRKQKEYVVQQYPVEYQGLAAWERLDNVTQYPDGNFYSGDCYPAPSYDVQCAQVQNQDYPVPPIPIAENLYSENREPAPSHDHPDLPIASCPRQPLAPLKQPRFILVSPNSRRRLQAVRKPSSPYTIPSRKTQKRARRNLPPVTESTVEVTIWRNEKPQMQQDLPVRPPFSYRTLANLACLNSPSGSVSLQEAYSFVLHHFPYYRLIEQSSWKSTLRKIMCRGELFARVFKDDSSSEVLYEMKNKNVDGVGYTDYEMEWINQDRRDIDFFRRMQRGQLGLPRQLFYRVMGLGCPKLAGPENSALFYHLWSLGHRFDNITNLFKTHKTEFTGEEPVFDEERVFLNLTNNHRIHVDKKWGYSVNMEDGLNWSERDSALFFKNIRWYFNEQNEMKRRNLPNWETPSLVRENIPRYQNGDLNTVNM